MEVQDDHIWNYRMTIYGITGWPYMELQDDHVWSYRMTIYGGTG